jgi:heat shock protein HslJ
VKLRFSRMPLAALCTAGALVAAACASTAPQAELDGTRWSVATLGGQTISGPAPTIEFENNRVVGTGGCNRYFGEYAAENGTLSVREVGSTEMACAPDIMSREAAFFAALAATRSYSRLGDTLLLSDGAGGTIMLRAA